MQHRGQEWVLHRVQGLTVKNAQTTGVRSGYCIECRRQEWVLQRVKGSGVGNAQSAGVKRT